MKVKVFNGNLLKKGVQLVKKAAIGIISGVIVLASVAGCSAEQHRDYETREPIDTSYSTVVEKTATNASKNFVYRDEIDTTKDVSDDYVSVFVGEIDGDGPIVADRNNIVRYKNSSNAFTREESDLEDKPLSITRENYEDLVEFLDNQKIDLPYSELFNVDHLLSKETPKNVEHRREFQFKNGKVDATSLYEIVKDNNDNYNYSVTFSDEELAYICDLLAQNLNYSLATNPYVDRTALGCVLSNLKIFRENDVTNARITDDGVLAISPDRIEDIKTNVAGTIDLFENTIFHEGGHFGQINCDDEIDRTKGAKLGFSQKWDNEAINSLYWKWYMEASAESIMMDQTEDANLVYTNQVDYLKYLKLVLVMRPEFKAEDLENVSYSRSREDFFALFGDLDESEKNRIIDIMYAIELIQNENDDFERVYLSHIGSADVALNAEEWVQIKRELKSGIAINLSAMFYKNLADAVLNGRVSLNDVYHVISVFEAEIESHNTYDSLHRYEANKPFIDAYIEMQNAFFSTLTCDYSYDEMLEGFDTYSYSCEANFEHLDSSQKEFIEMRREELTTSTATNIRSFGKAFQSVYDTDRVLVNS